MNKVKKIVLKNYKKFDNKVIEFKDGINILIGENGTGKSTVLEALDLALNPRFLNNHSNYRDQISVSRIKKFEENPSLRTLPSFELQVFLELESTPQNSKFFGSCNVENIEAFGVKVVYEFNDEFTTEVTEEINNGNIPFEFYTIRWLTFQDNTFISKNKPISSISVDHTSTNGEYSMNKFTREYFESSYVGNEGLHLKNSFNNHIKDFDIPEGATGDVKIAIDESKAMLDNILTIKKGGIKITNLGKGHEIKVKNDISIKKVNENEIDLLLLEEPENHLSHNNLKKMVADISKLDKQCILTTHNSLIVSGNSLNKLIFISAEKINILEELDQDTSEYFVGLEYSSLLEFLLSNKVILVEGKTECMLIPKIYEKMYAGNSFENSGIHVISCNGITYKRFIDLAKVLKKKVLIITDNDEKVEEVNEKIVALCLTENIRISYGEENENWTLEASFYNENIDYFNINVPVNEKSKYIFKKVNYRDINKPVLGKMLNTKTDTARLIINNINEINIPSYITEGIQWLKQD